ncbi:hypothetical protein [Nocardia asteroides]|uniref:hypothetical protein n=1 Tax=Nocardia asteroides TaxID=1824 RepID=UPI0033C95CCA
MTRPPVRAGRSEPPVPGRYVRFQGTHPDGSGRHPGVFVLVERLSAAGQLTAEQERFRRSGDEWFAAHLVDPYRVHPRVRRPGAAAWFKSTALPMLDRVTGYLTLLDAHGVGWERLDTDTPGIVLYDDPLQIVAVTQRPRAAREPRREPRADSHDTPPRPRVRRWPTILNCTRQRCRTEGSTTGSP